MSKPKHHKAYGGGRIRRTKNGRYDADVCDHSRRYRKRCETEEEAMVWIDATMRAMGARDTPLDAVALDDARRAFALLPAGITLLDAARAYVDAHTSAEPITVETAMEAFLTEKAEAGLRPRAIGSLSGQCRRILPEVGEMNVGDVRPEHLSDWLTARDLSLTTRGNYLRAWTNFFGWCKRRGYCRSNIVDALTRPRVDDTLPVALNIAQCKALLSALRDFRPHVRVYACLSLFAGLRPQEAARIHWDAINAEHIHVGPAVAKTRQQRLVTIEPNLGAILERYRTTGPVCPVVTRHDFRRARLAAKIDPWPQDALRHSFATYHLARYQDAARTAHEMGHTGTAMLYRHYRGLATKAEAEEYWTLDV